MYKNNALFSGGTWETNGNKIYYNTDNVGIGTNNPAKKLDVVGNGKFTTNLEVGGEINTKTITHSGNHMYIKTTSDNHIIFSTNGSEILRLEKSGGNVGIGTNSPGQKLEVNGTVKATNYIATSDRNLKENIVQINNENVIDKVTSLNGYNFNFKDDETKQTKSGLIAQEVEELMPELVSTNTDGNKSMDYNGMIPYLVECIKVQQTQIQSQQTQIQSQQNQINMLKAKIENM